jgi:predicted TIM-barrel fold metal-dependent hydrolase
MYETNFPHPTCIAPGPASMTDSARNVIDKNLHALPDDILKKLLFENAARVYGVSAH